MPSILEESPEVKLVHDFVNTLDLRTFRHRGQQRAGDDALAGAGGFGAWLAERALIADPGEVAERDLPPARATRAALRASITGDPGSAAAPPPVQVQLVPGEAPRLAPAEAGVSGALAQIVLAAAAITQQGLWARLKQCPADDCHWIFYDRTKPASGRWCDPTLCGNRMKTRAYRTRRAAGAPLAG